MDLDEFTQELSVDKEEMGARTDHGAMNYLGDSKGGEGDTKGA